MNRPKPAPIGLADLDAFTLAYVACALWSSTDNGYFGEGDPRNNACGRETGGDPLDDNFAPSDIHPDSLAKMATDCRNFRDHCAETGVSLVELDDEQAGHDFWLTRNGHGTGFWDRGLGKLGDDLTEAAKTFGSSDLCVGDDGRVHAS